MKRWHVITLLVLGLGVGAGIAAVRGRGVPPAQAAKRYVCAPCGASCDTKVFDSPGTCPVCGMKLVEQGAPKAEPPAKKVAILVFDGVEIIDFTGPYEVFGAAGFDVYTVSEKKQPIVTAMGLTVTAKYALSDAPEPDVVVVPGGDVHLARESATTLKWIKDESARAPRTMSVCNGAFILASAGMLDGLTVTTTAGQIDRLAAAFPKTKVVRDRRFVDNGKIVTTAGLSSGIDGALHVVDAMLGHGAAQRVALGIEYDWRPDAGYARAALADRFIPDVDLDSLGHFDVASTQGGTDRWEMTVAGTSERTAAQIAERFEQAFVAAKWTKAAGGSAPTASAAASSWTFQPDGGAPWKGSLAIGAVAGQSRAYSVSVRIARLD